MRIKRFKNTITKKYIRLLNRMSNSASISAAKKRRGGGPPPMGGGGPGQGQGQAMGMPPGLPPGLPPNFRQLPPHIQQQLFMQLQQRAAAAAAAAKSAPGPPQSMPPAPIQTRVPTPGQGGGGGGGSMPNTQGPYTVNNVIHNRAMAEVNGVHIRDLPISAAGLPCSPSGAALPPNVLFKLHHDELLNMDAVLNEHSNRIQMLSNRLDKGAGVGVGAGAGSVSYNGDDTSSRNITDYDSLVNNTAFITKLLDNILTNTNLSDIINQIEPLQKENESLRALLNSQQTTLNELSGLVMKLLANGLPSYSSYSNNENIENNDNNETNENIENRVYDSYDNTLMNGASSVYNPNTVYDANNINDECTLTVTELHNLPDGEENEDEEEEEEDEGEDATDENQEEGQHVDN